MGNLPIQPYDLVMLVVLAMATLFGLWKGMAWQVASLASLVASFFVAMRLSGPVAPYISSQEPWNRFIAILVLYVATSAAIWLAFRLVARIIDKIKLHSFDHQVGAVFGFVKGVLWCVVITFFAVTLSESLRQSVLTTYSGRTIATLIKQTSPVMPPEVRKVLGSYIDQLDRKLDPGTPAAEPATSLPIEIPRSAERPTVRLSITVPEAPRIAEQPEPPEDPPQPPERPLRLPAEEPRSWDRPSYPPPRFAPPAEERGRDAEIPLFPVKLPSRDRT